MENFTYLNSELSREVVWWIDIMDLLSTSIWQCWYMCKLMKILIFKLLMISVLLYGCKTWTLNTNMKRRSDVFGTRCLHRIMGYRWYDFVSKQRLFCEIDSRPIISIVRQRQLQINVARYVEADPAYRVVSKRDKPTWRRPHRTLGCGKSMPPAGSYSV